MILGQRSKVENRAVRGILALVFCCSLAAPGLPSAASQVEKPAAVKEIVFTKELTIGVAEGDENYMFGKAISFSVDGRGNIYVLDFDRKHVRKFGPDGKYILTIGRQGQGPGEFQYPSEARLSPDGNIYITESTNKRVHHYDPLGKFLGDIVLPDDIRDIWWAPKGTYLGILERAPMYVGQGNVEYHYTIFDDKFKPIVELYNDVIDLKMPEDRSPARWRAEGASYFLARPTASAVMREDGRMYFGLSNVYAVDVFSPEGKKLRTITRDIAPAEYSKEDIDFAWKLREDLYTDLPEAVRKEIRSLIRFPKLKPFFRGLAPMDDGKLAVVVDYNSMDACTLDIFEDEGTFQGRVKAPISWVNLLFKAGKAYCVRTDENGYKTIERYSYALR